MLLPLLTVGVVALAFLLAVFLPVTAYQTNTSGLPSGLNLDDNTIALGTTDAAAVKTLRTFVGSPNFLAAEGGVVRSVILSSPGLTQATVAVELQAADGVRNLWLGRHAVDDWTDWSLWLRIDVPGTQYTGVVWRDGRILARNTATTWSYWNLQEAGPSATAPAGWVCPATAQVFLVPESTTLLVWQDDGTVCSGTWVANGAPTWNATTVLATGVLHLSIGSLGATWTTTHAAGDVRVWSDTAELFRATVTDAQAAWFVGTQARTGRLVVRYTSETAQVLEQDPVTLEWVALGALLAAPTPFHVCPLAENIVWGTSDLWWVPLARPYAGVRTVAAVEAADQVAAEVEVVAGQGYQLVAAAGPSPTDPQRPVGSVFVAPLW